MLEDRADRPTVKVLYEAALLGLLLSMTVDHYQIFSPARLPTMTDVLMNTVGALLGASLGANRWSKPEANSDEIVRSAAGYVRLQNDSCGSTSSGDRFS